MNRAFHSNNGHFSSSPSTTLGRKRGSLDSHYASRIACLDLRDIAPPGSGLP